MSRKVTRHHRKSHGGKSLARTMKRAAARSASAAASKAAQAGRA